MKRLAVFVLMSALFLVLSIRVSASGWPHTDNIIFMYGKNSEQYENMLSKTQGQAGTVSPPYFFLDQNGNLVAKVDQQFGLMYIAKVTG